MTVRNRFVAARGGALAVLCGGLCFAASSAAAEDNFRIVIAPRIAAGQTQDVALQVDEQDEPAAQDGLPTIVPRESADAPADADAPQAAGGEAASGYAATFRSIPFSRAEFDANPSYRHEATMEILTGNPRPQKIFIQQPAPAPPMDYYLPNLPVMRHYFDMSRGPYSRYQSLFGYTGGYRLQYYHN